MSTVTETPAGWSFIFKGQRYEFPDRETARERLYDLQRDRAPAHAALDEIAPIRVERQVCEDSLDPRFGQEIATRYLIGTSDDEVELWVPDHASAGSWVELYGLETGDGLKVGAARHLLDVTVPLAQRLLGDPRVRQAILDAEVRLA